MKTLSCPFCGHIDLTGGGSVPTKLRALTTRGAWRKAERHSDERHRGVQDAFSRLRRFNDSPA